MDIAYVPPRGPAGRRDTRRIPPPGCGFSRYRRPIGIICGFTRRSRVKPQRVRTRGGGHLGNKGSSCETRAPGGYVAPHTGAESFGSARVLRKTSLLAHRLETVERCAS
ncbi:unnamed protein product [Merluccius merluccius]